MNTLILAGSFDQARQFATEHGLQGNEWRYASSHMVRGRMEPTVYLVGDYYTRPDYRRTLAALMPARPTFLNEKGDLVDP